MYKAIAAILWQPVSFVYIYLFQFRGHIFYYFKQLFSGNIIDFFKNFFVHFIVIYFY